MRQWGLLAGQTLAEIFFVIFGHLFLLLVIISSIHFETFEFFSTVKNCLKLCYFNEANGSPSEEKCDIWERFCDKFTLRKKNQALTQKFNLYQYPCIKGWRKEMC